MEFNQSLFYRLSTSATLCISVNVMKFPGGEIGVNINSGEPTMNDVLNVEFVRIYSRIRSSDDLMALLLATDAIRQVYPQADIHLALPYVPYARQDRVCNDGESLSIKVLASIINAQGYKTVEILDPHSAVTSALLDRVWVRTQHDAFKNIPLAWKDVTLVAPDQGALKKTEDFAKRVGAAGVISCTKHRELSTGKITGLYVNGPGDMSSMNLLVLDDICDGGRTFIELAKVLNANPYTAPHTLNLAVTHGIFSKGLDILLEHYGQIYTTDSFNTLQHERLTVINL